MTTTTEALARNADLQRETSRMLAAIVRDNLRDNPHSAVALNREFLHSVHNVLRTVAELPRESLTLAAAQGRCSALAGILEELLK